MASYSATVKTNGANLMIRKGPSTSSSYVGRIPNGTQITISNIQDTGGGWKWATVTYNGVTGYCCINEPGVGTWITVGAQINDTQTTPAPQAPAAPKLDSSEAFSAGLDNALSNLMKTSINGGSALKASMRLFGLPFQYPSFIDCRIDNVSKILGRKFIENIIFEAPILTIIPGKPLYLPAAKNKRGTAQALMSAANGSFADLSTLGKTMTADALRYFDFQQDYIEYMKYVNILCRVGAGFLELGDIELDGTPLTKYNWMNYRYTSESYQSTAANIMSSTLDAAKGTISTLKTFGAEALKTATLGAIDLTGNTSKTTGNKVQFDSDSGDKSVLEALDSILANMNFVQFYIDPTSSFSESASNTTTTSKLEGLFDTGSDLIKEMSFILNAGGGDAQALSDFTSESLAAMTDTVFKNSNGGISGFLKRILDSGSNILKGENFIIPEIYQKSEYGKSYSVSTTLRAPYNDKYSYYMNMFVPMMHWLALCIPKQTTANTYGSPFLIKAYLPGIFNCNLGIVESISIEKNIGSGDGLSVDGLPTEIKITMTIKDLYSELMMTPSNSPLLFMSNSSLIDYLAVNCGLDLVMPQIENKVDYLMDVISSAFTDIPENIKGEFVKAVDNLVSGWIKLN